MPVEVRSHERVTNYQKFWQKHSANDTEDHRIIRFDKYTDLVNGRLHVSNLLMAKFEKDTMMALPSFMSTAGVSMSLDISISHTDLLSAESFHFCRFFKGEAFLQAVSISQLLTTELILLSSPDTSTILPP